MAGHAPARATNGLSLGTANGVPRPTSRRRSLPSGVERFCPVPWGSAPEPPCPEAARGGGVLPGARGVASGAAGPEGGVEEAVVAEGEPAAVVVREGLAHEEQL